MVRMFPEERLWRAGWKEAEVETCRSDAVEQRISSEWV